MSEDAEELDPRMIDEDGEFRKRINYHLPRHSINCVAQNVYPLPRFETISDAHDLLDRALEDLAIQSENGGRPPDIGRNIVQQIRDLGGVGLIVADPQETEFVVRAAQGGARGRLGETDGIDHMLFDEIDDDEWGERLTERLDDDALDRLLRDLVQHGHRDVDEVREMLDRLE